MTGQFTQQDPIGIAGGANVYGFADGDPINFDDPFGLCPQCIVALLRTGPYIVAGARLVAEALDPHPEPGIGAEFQSGAKMASRAAHFAQEAAAALGKSWSTQRRWFWKAESIAEDAAERWGGGELGTANVERMKQGLAPRMPDLDGRIRSMDLSHEPFDWSAGGTQVVPRTPLAHQQIDPRRGVEKP